MLEECGVDVSDGFGSLFGGFGDRRGGGGFDGGGFGGAFTPEAIECLTERLGEDFADGFGGFGGRDSGGQTESSPFGGGLAEEFTAALEECGVDFGGGGFGGFGGFGGRGGGGDGFGGRGFRGGAGGFGDGSLQECLTELLGAGALDLLRNPADGPSPELLEAFEECGGPIPGEPDGGTGDRAVPVEPTPTPIPVNDLTIEQLTCLSGELAPAALASAVIATSSGDLSELSDVVLAALETCGFES